MGGVEEKRWINYSGYPSSMRKVYGKTAVLLQNPVKYVRLDSAVTYT